MDVAIIDILRNYGNSTVESIRQNLSSTGTNATGKTSSTLRYELTHEGTKATLKIIGRPYFTTVETGRKATPDYKPSKEFVKAIKEWAEAKGVDTKFAYSIALSIHKKGTKLHQRGGRDDVYSNVINESLTDKISADLLKQFSDKFFKTVVTIFDERKRFTAA